MVKQYDIFYTDLDPTKGREINKVRPCVVISPNHTNLTLGTVLVAPLTTKKHAFPMRVDVIISNKHGFVMLDQIRCVDKRRLVRKIGKLSKSKVEKVKAVLKEYLVD